MPVDQKSLHVLIVDDEPLARQLMRLQLHKCSQKTTVSEAASAALAKTWLEQNPCDVILLDIHMPDVSGLELAHELQNIRKEGVPPFIIFVTADSDHALEAFNLAALDYLTKPVSLERLEKTLERVNQQITQHNNHKTTENEHFVNVESHQEILRLPLNQILYFQADNKYTLVITKVKEHSYILEDSLNALEQQFGEHVVRAHRSYLIVSSSIKKLVRQDASAGQDAWCVQLHDANTCIPISRRQLSTVKKLLNP